MAHPSLDNLVTVGSLDAEPANADEFQALISTAKIRLKDSSVPGLSLEGKFDRAYQAAHVLALAAVRWHGYRPKHNRIVVFQALAHTVRWPPEKWRVLSAAHTKRNAVQYDAEMNIEESLIADVIRLTTDLLAAVEGLGTPATP